MLAYPSISKQVVDVAVYAFDKIDGSCIRVEWSRKHGFSKFGSRTRLLDPQERPLGLAVPLFHETMAEALEPVLRNLRVERATLFMEFAGESSFAGLHEEHEEHTLTLFDVSLYKKGFMFPKEFLNTFEDRVPTPGMLYHGKANREFQECVHTGELEGMTFEGVVCKAQEPIRNRPVVFKVKNRAWLERLHTFAKGDEALFKKLA